MPPVTFAFASQLGIPAQDALDLAELLMRGRTIAGISAAAKVRHEAERQPGEVSKDVALNADELEVLARLLDEELWPRDKPWREPLRQALAEALPV